MVVLGEPLRVLPDLVKLSRATVSIIRQNIIGFAFGLNAVAMGSAALGVIGPVAAAILHQVGSLLVLLNSMRLLAFGDWANLTPIRWLRGVARALARLDDRLDPGRALDQIAIRWRLVVSLALGAGLFLYATWGWAAIGPDEVGLVRRQGRFVGRLGPGLHLRWPPPWERVDRLRPGRLRSVTLGFRSEMPEAGEAAVRWESPHERGVVARRVDEALLMTGDGQLVELAATAQYRLDERSHSLEAYAFGAADPDGALRPLAESSLREVVSRSTLVNVLTAERHEAEQATASLLQERASAYRLGLIITGVEFQDVHPPLAVVDAYRDVSRAQSERQKWINEGQTYRAERIVLAGGTAAATLEQAEADRQAKTTRAGAEAYGFLTRHQARASSPALTDHRLYWEAAAAALANKAKLVLDPAQAGLRRHLFMTDFPLGAPAPELKSAAPLFIAPDPAKEPPAK